VASVVLVTYLWQNDRLGLGLLSRDPSAGRVELQSDY